MRGKPITQRAGTKYGSAPANQEVTVDAGGKDVARFPRMSPLKNSALIKGAGDVGNSQNRPAKWNQTDKTEGDDQIIKGKEKTKIEIKPPVRTKEGDEAYAKLTPEQRKAQDDKYRSRKENQIEVGTGEFEPDQIIKGEGKEETYQGNLYAKQSGTATSSYGGRSDRRNVKATTKDQYKNKIRGLRSQIGSDILDEEGNPTGQKYTRQQFKKDKQSARTQMFENRQTAFDNQQENLQRQIEQGRVKNESYRRPDRVKTYGDYGDDKQMQMGIAQQKADRVRNQAAAADAKSYFKAKAGLLTDDSFTIGGGLSDFKTNTPSLTKPKSLMYDLSSVGSNSPSSTQPFDGLSQEDQYTLARSGVQKRGYKMKGFGAKNK